NPTHANRTRARTEIELGRAVVEPNGPSLTRHHCHFRGCRSAHTTQSSGCVRRAEPVTATEVCRGAVEWKQPLTHRDHGGSGPVPGRETESHRLVDSGSGVSGTARRVLQLGVVVAVSNTAHARVASRVSG